MEPGCRCDTKRRAAERPGRLARTGASVRARSRAAVRAACPPVRSAHAAPPWRRRCCARAENLARRRAFPEPLRWARRCASGGLDVRAPQRPRTSPRPFRRPATPRTTPPPSPATARRRAVRSSVPTGSWPRGSQRRRAAPLLADVTARTIGRSGAAQRKNHPHAGRYGNWRILRPRNSIGAPSDSRHKCPSRGSQFVPPETSSPLTHSRTSPFMHRT